MILDLRTMLQTWVLVLTRPGIDVFKSERLKPSATLTIALVWTVLAGAVSAILQLVHAQLYASTSAVIWPYSLLMSSEIQAALEEVPASSPIQILSGFLTAPVAFVFMVGIQHLIASQMGINRIRLEPSGEKRYGKFGRYVYLNATFGAPLSVLSSLLSLVPLLYSLTYFIVAIYQLVLAYFATRAEYGLSRGQVIVVVLAGPIIAGGGTGFLISASYFLGVLN